MTEGMARTLTILPGLLGWLAGNEGMNPGTVVVPDCSPYIHFIQPNKSDVVPLASVLFVHLSVAINKLPKL